MNRITTEIIIIALISVITYWIFGYIELLEKVNTWALRHDDFEIDEFLSTSVVLVFLLLIFSIRRLLDSRNETKKLEMVLKELHTLEGVTPSPNLCSMLYPCFFKVLNTSFSIRQRARPARIIWYTFSVVRCKSLTQLNFISFPLLRTAIIQGH